MHPTIFREFERLVGELRPRGRILEIGAVPRPNTLLAIPSIAEQDRVGINLIGGYEYGGFSILKGNANSMPMFLDASFDCVLSNATLEHDGWFWKTCAEIRRILKPGALAVIGVPGFTVEAGLQSLKIPSPWPVDEFRDWQASCLTFRYHGAPYDYYRFSENGVREAIFEGFRDISIKAVMMPPRLIGVGYRN